MKQVTITFTELPDGGIVPSWEPEDLLRIKPSDASPAEQAAQQVLVLLRMLNNVKITDLA